MKNFIATKWIRVLSVTSFFFLFSNALAAEAYMKIPDIPGESKREGHENEIVLRSASGEFSEGNCGVFNVDKELDTASPKLIEAVVKGKVIPSVEIEWLANIEDKSETFYKVKLNQVRLISLTSNGDAEGRPSESLEMYAASMELAYQPFNNDGNVEPEVKVELICAKKLK